MSETERAAALRGRFMDRFGGAARVYRAPGRVNLIGEHTDYNEGFVFPVAISLSCRVAAAARDDNSIVVESDAMRGSASWNVNADPPSERVWSTYVFGVAAMLRRHGHLAGGATLLVDSDVPIGSGLSSSAALEVAIATALLDLADARLPGTTVARVCQQAESQVVGTRCGIMDQYVACHGREEHALLLDCRSLDHQTVRLPAHLCLIACNTLVRHSHAAGEYNQRRAECEEGVRAMAAIDPTISSLRDVTPLRLESDRSALSDVVFRRCRHVVSENMRVREMARALERDDHGAIGVLMGESHRSLREDYEVSCPELNALVELARDVPGVVGARMTGGGFGGCTANLVRADAVEEFCRHVIDGYERRFGRCPEIYVTAAADGAARIL
jgi:galactokinase